MAKTQQTRIQPGSTSQFLMPNKRDQIFIILSVIFLLFNLTDLAQRIQFWLLNLVLIYCAYVLAPFLYNALPFIEKELIESRGKAVLVTGCDSGFGHYLAKRLVAKGYYVFAACLSGTSDGAQHLRSNYRTDDQLLVVPLDVTNDQSVESARQIVSDKISSLNRKSSKYSNFGLWAVVNNAGILSLLEIEFGNMKPFTQQMEVNCMGVVRVTKAFLPLIRRNKFCRGRVVNVASLAGRFTMPGFVAYCMSKGAVITFSDGLRRELAKWNIEVVCIEPHLYKTNLVNRERLTNDYDQGWQTSSNETKQDYGNDYFDGFVRTMETALDTARDQIDQVVDTLERAVTQEIVESHYQVMKHVERIRVWFFSTLAPTPLVDYLMCKALTNGNGKPSMLKED
ncbi:hypothetical protein BLOT_015959 [Blomia tropicalis]|nr:hypothetical protein BLOT_015959 [Blomia tropicalis]